MLCITFQIIHWATTQVSRYIKVRLTVSGELYNGWWQGWLEGKGLMQKNNKQEGEEMNQTKLWAIQG